MKFGLARTKAFKKSYKKLRLKDNEVAIYIDVVSNLLNGVGLDKRYKDHSLKGNFEQYRECHLKPDLLLIYRVYEGEVQLIDIGSHSELFE
jgi:mRNA interferase YafQ